MDSKKNNERNLRKSLKSKENKKGHLTYVLLDDYIDNKTNEDKLPSKHRAFIRKLLPHKSMHDVVASNFPLILEKTDPQFAYKTLQLMAENEQLSDIVKDNIDKVLDMIINIGKTQPDMLFGDYKDMINLFKRKYGKQIIEDHLDKVIEGLPMSIFVHEMKCLKGISEKVDIAVNEHIEKNIEKFIEGMMDSYKIQLSQNDKKRLLAQYLPTVYELLKELLPRKTINGEEKVWWMNIEKIGYGVYSDVFRVGSRVLKIGDLRTTYKIPNHSRILQPIARFELLMGNNNIPYACIEISDKVDKLTRQDYREENFYKVYKELRDDGIICSDFKISNLGKLRGDNSPIHFVHGDKIDVVPSSVGFIGEMKGKKLKQGDLVVLDTDFIYKADDPRIMWQSSGYSKQFEARWQMEKQAENAEQHQDEVSRLNIEEREM